MLLIPACAYLLSYLLFKGKLNSFPDCVTYILFYGFKFVAVPLASLCSLNFAVNYFFNAKGELQRVLAALVALPPIIYAIIATYVAFVFGK